VAKIKIDGNTLDLEDAIVATDKGLCEALAPYYPAVANATIKREKKGDETIITVTKKAGVKGAFASVLNELDEAPEQISPILAIEATGWRKSNKLAVDDALLQLFADETEIQRITNALDAAESQSANTRPQGF
jgi:hypothetical protein